MHNQSGVLEVTVTFSLGLGVMAPPLCVWKVQVITLDMFGVSKNNADTWAPKAVNFTLNNIFSITHHFYYFVLFITVVLSILKFSLPFFFNFAMCGNCVSVCVCAHACTDFQPNHTVFKYSGLTPSFQLAIVFRHHLRPRGQSGCP